MTFLMYTSMKQILFSGVVIDLEGSTDENKHTEDLFSVLFFPTQLLCRSKHCFVQHCSSHIFY